jgi:hypothetical protein
MERQFRPEMISRQGERNAWGLAIVTMVAWLVFRIRIPALGSMALIFGVLLTLSAAMISLSNWVDRQTRLTLNAEGVAFRNGLRNVSLKWDQIEKVQVVTDRFGERVHVFGTTDSSSTLISTRFNFRTLSPIKMKGQTRGNMGFSDGEEILHQILKSAGLSEIQDNEDGHYYARP